MEDWAYYNAECTLRQQRIYLSLEGLCFKTFEFWIELRVGFDFELSKT